MLSIAEYYQVFTIKILNSNQTKALESAHIGPINSFTMLNFFEKVTESLALYRIVWFFIENTHPWYIENIYQFKKKCMGS